MPRLTDLYDHFVAPLSEGGEVVWQLRPHWYALDRFRGDGSEILIEGPYGETISGTEAIDRGIAWAASRIATPPQRIRPTARVGDVHIVDAEGRLVLKVESRARE